jgi:hypothetical protein
MKQTVQAVSAGDADWRVWVAALDAKLDAERDVARLAGESYAVDLDLGLEWDIGAPLPHLLAIERRTFLVFSVKDPPEGGMEPGSRWSTLPTSMRWRWELPSSSMFTR